MSPVSELQPVSPVQGESGYFSALAPTLDPRLFSGDSVRPEVRAWVLTTLYRFWDTRYAQAHNWSTVWIAGSGISYQWQASRGNGDLDILIGVDFPSFFRYNQKFQGLSENDMAEVFNQEFHAELWPTTEHTEINDVGVPNPIGTQNIFEVTFYVNPNSADIRNIHPYAAYNLSNNTWTVRPPGQNDTVHPQEYYAAAQEEQTRANEIVSRYNQAATSLQSMQQDSPGFINARTQADLLASQAQQMFDDIHLGRKQAFAEGGHGYGDYYNFRWQYHKQQGTVQTLHEVADYHKALHEHLDAQRYGGPIEGADVVLRRAAMWNRGM